MTSRRASLTRRSLLTGMGAAAVALPFLRNAPSAHAEDGAKRFVVFFSPNEPIDKAHWEPGAGFALHETMDALEPHKDKLLLIGDVRMHTRDKDGFGGGHVGIGHLLTGEINNPYGSDAAEFWAGGVSVNQLIAQRLGVSALTLGVRPGGANGNSRISYSAANEPVHPIDDPIKAFDQVLGDFTLPPDVLAERRAQQKSVLDAIAGQLDTLNGRLSGEDRQKLERHLDSIREVEKGLSGTGSISCEPTAPGGGVDHTTNANYPRTGRRQIDVLVQALACGVTQVGSLQLGNSGSSHSTPVWPDDGIDISVDEHNICHDYNTGKSAETTARRVELERFYYSQFAYLLQQLASYPEGTGTLLDNTLVLWGKPIGYNHSGKGMLFMLAGGAGGALQTGRYIERTEQAHNDLLVSCCNLMGFDDVTTFGDPEICTGAMAL